MPRFNLSPALKGFVHVLTGTVGARVITVLALLLISRLYTPEAFGFYSVVVAATGVIVPAVALRFEAAAMLPRRLQEVRAVVWNALFSIVAISIIYAVALFLFAALDIAEISPNPSLPLWVFFLVGMGGVFQLFSQLALRKQEYKLVGRREVWRASATSFSQIGMGFLPGFGSGLLVGNVFGSVVGIGAMVSRTRDFLNFPGLTELKAVWRKYWRFPAIFAPSAIINAFGVHGPLIFFSALYGVSVAGQLGMAERIVTIPVVLVGAAVGQLVEAEISKRIRDRAGRLFETYLKLSVVLSGLALAMVLAFTLFGPVLVPWVLGDQWVEVGNIVQILAVSSGFRLIVSPLSKYLVLLQKAFANIVLDILRLVLVVSTMVISVVFDLALMPALWLVYSSMSLTYVVTWIYTAVIVRREAAGIVGS